MKAVALTPFLYLVTWRQLRQFSGRQVAVNYSRIVFAYDGQDAINKTIDMEIKA